MYYFVLQLFRNIYKSRTPIINMVKNYSTKVLTFRVKDELHDKIQIYLKKENDTLTNILTSYLELLVKPVNMLKILENEKILRVQKELILEIQKELAEDKVNKEELGL